MNCPSGKLGNYPHCPGSEGLGMGGKATHNSLVSVGMEGSGERRKTTKDLLEVFSDPKSSSL